MAKYKVIKCELLKDRNEFNYLKLELLNTHLMWEPTIALLIHDPNVISRIIDATSDFQKKSGAFCFVRRWNFECI